MVVFSNFRTVLVLPWRGIFIAFIAFNSSSWPAPGLDDTDLSKSGLPLELHRAKITDRRVPAFRIVEALDVVELPCRLR